MRRFLVSVVVCSGILGLPPHARPAPVSESRKPAEISHQQTANSNQASAIRNQSSAVSNQQTGISKQQTGISKQQPATKPQTVPVCSSPGLAAGSKGLGEKGGQGEKSCGVKDWLRAGFSFYVHDQHAKATAAFSEALRLAGSEHDRGSIAEAHRGLGLVSYIQGQYSEAETQLNTAMAEYQALPDSLGIARTRQNLGMVASVSKGDWVTARRLYQQALQEYQRRHDWKDEASVLRDLDFDPTLKLSEQIQNIQRGLALLRGGRDTELEGSFLEDWGDALFGEGDYAGAIEKLERAERRFERVGDRFSLARVFTSEGRIYRAHGLPDRAITLDERALEIERQIGDAYGAVQSMSAIASAYDLLGQPQKSLAEYEAARRLALRTKSPRLLAYLDGNIASEQLTLKQYAQAERGLNRALALEKSPYLRAYRLAQLSQTEYRLQRYTSSEQAATQALALHGADRDEVLKIFYWRARSEEKLGHPRQALADVNSSLRILEQIRLQLAPDDFMRRHFSDWSGFLYDFAVALNYQLEQPRQALAMAEAGRARALEDLLASRNAAPAGKESATIKATGALLARSEPQSGLSGKAVGQLTLRGAAPGGLSAHEADGTRPGVSQGGEASLANFAGTQPFSVAQMAAAAAQWHSTILSFWTGAHATYIWVIKPDGTLGSAKVDVSRDQLAALVRTLWPKPRLEFHSTAISDQKSEISRQKSAPSGRGPAGSAVRSPGQTANGRNELTGGLIGRGGDELTFASSGKPQWRELYNLLIQPVARYMPPSGSLLTIEPNGPLLLLPFAALMDGHGHYLVERYRTNYLPSVSLFPYVENEREKTGTLPSHFLLVADPDHVGKGPYGERLPALPGARKEVAEIAQRLPADEVTLLVGRSAQEQRVRQQLSEATVIHFATHAILDNRLPSDSYLALGASGTEEKADGRLTAEEVYSLHLHAKLVFLSACRTGMGRVSADGVVGLTRAFFYAGAASLVGSLWDVSDETTVWLVPDFYRHWLGGRDKSQALRDAQLDLLHALRAGRIKIQTPYGRYALPEDPVLWASFVLEGEP